ncbi:MAG: DUF460 domain-containing protein [Candidatus Marsarchaeota archaeon]|nr:DUF460 domain-containing protein [Candidatus Marsarchaeota archaeon]
MNHIIVGIDTGKTSAIACTDLHGNIVSLYTGKSEGLPWFVEKIRESGIPVIISGDKKRSQETVRKLASIFNCVLFAPREDIPVWKKNEELSMNKVSSIHERDALSAAKAAYNKYANKLGQADRLARLSNADPDSVKAMVIRRYSVYEAVNKKDRVNRFFKK